MVVLKVYLSFFTFLKFFQIETADGKITTKLKIYFLDDLSNIYDILVYLVFYIALVLRFIPTTASGCIFATESCFEAGR